MRLYNNSYLIKLTTLLGEYKTLLGLPRLDRVGVISKQVVVEVP